MSDLIDRQQTVEYLCKYMEWVNEEYCFMDTDEKREAVKEMLSGIPSAQPEIVRCKDCKYYKKDHGWNCIEYTVCSISPIHKVIRKPNDYCSRAERREDGSD